MRCSAISAVTRVFDALWRCTADPGSLWALRLQRSRVCSAPLRAALRPGNTLRKMSCAAEIFRRFSKNLTFATKFGGSFAGSRYVRRPGFDGALPQMRGAVDLCHLGSAPEISRDAADDVRLLPMQSHLELRPGAGHGRSLCRQR